MGPPPGPECSTAARRGCMYGAASLATADAWSRRPAAKWSRMVRSITSSGVMPSASALSAISLRLMVAGLREPFGRPAPGRFPPRGMLISSDFEIRLLSPPHEHRPDPCGFVLNLHGDVAGGICRSGGGGPEIAPEGGASGVCEGGAGFRAAGAGHAQSSSGSWSAGAMAWRMSSGTSSASMISSRAMPRVMPPVAVRSISRKK